MASQRRFRATSPPLGASVLGWVVGVGNACEWGPPARDAAEGRRGVSAHGAQSLTAHQG